MTMHKTKLAPNPNGSADQTNMGVESLDKVREILFGAQVREHDKRYNDLESRLSNDIVTLQEQTKRMFESLRLSMDKQIQSLSARVDTEESQREAANKDLVNLIKETKATLEDRMSQMARRSEEVAGQIRQSIADQTRTLKEEFDKKQAGLEQVLNQSVTQIRDRMVDRSALATLLTQVATQLGHKNGGDKRSK